MTIDHPATYLGYEEQVELVAQRLQHVNNIERLRDEMRRIKQGLSFETLAELIPVTVEKWASEYPAGDVSGQNIYDFLKLKLPNTPNLSRRLEFHAFMMIVDEAYAGKWNHTYWVRTLGFSLSNYYSTKLESELIKLPEMLKKQAGLYGYLGAEEIIPSYRKEGYQFRCLLLRWPKGYPFLLAYDFDYVIAPEPQTGLSEDELERYLPNMQNSMNLDACVGFFIPKHSLQQGLLFLNNFKWRWPQNYASKFIGTTGQSRIDVCHEIELSEIGSFENFKNHGVQVFKPDDVVDNDVRHQIKWDK